MYSNILSSYQKAIPYVSAGHRIIATAQVGGKMVMAFAMRQNAGPGAQSERIRGPSDGHQFPAEPPARSWRVLHVGERRRHNAR